MPDVAPVMRTHLYGKVIVVLGLFIVYILREIWLKEGIVIFYIRVYKCSLDSRAGSIMLLGLKMVGMWWDVFPALCPGCWI